MLEHTRIILVKNTLSDSLSACKSLKLQGFILPINTEWCGVIVPNEEDIEKATKNISKKTKTFAFLYEHVEDYGWYYHLYNEGKQITTLHIYYIEDEDDTDNINHSLLKDLALSKSHIETFGQLLQTDYRGEEYYLLDLFKEGFQFQHVKYLSYENIDSMESWQLEELKVELLTSATKKADFYDHIISLFEKALKQMDFILDTKIKNELHVRFNRQIDNFVYTVVFDQSEKNRLKFTLLTPFDDYQTYQTLANSRLNIKLNFQSKKELNELLEKYGYIFIKRANEFVTNNPVIIGNVDTTYEKKISTLLEKYGFEQVDFPSNIIRNGGVITYQKGNNFTISIKHYQGLTDIEPVIVYKQNKYFISKIIKYHGKILDLHLEPGEEIYFTFRNEKEFFQTVDKLMNYIEWILQTGVENVVI